jgi:drug/metabolite transporter (DMT)-like permease
MTLLVVQLAAANVVLWIALLGRGYRRPAHPWKVAFLGILEPGLCYALVTLGLLSTSAANAAVLGGLDAFFAIVLAAIFLHERLTTRSIVGLAVALAGVLLLEGEHGMAGIHVGDLLIVGGVAATALYVVLARTVAGDEDTLTLTAHQFAAGLIVALPFAIVRWANGSEKIFEPRPAFAWIAALIVGIVCYAGSFLLYNFAIAHTGAGLSSMILNLIPVFGLGAALLLLREGVNTVGLIGAALVIVSILIFPKAPELEPVRAAALERPDNQQGG